MYRLPKMTVVTDFEMSLEKYISQLELGQVTLQHFIASEQVPPESNHVQLP